MANTGNVVLPAFGVSGSVEVGTQANVSQVAVELFQSQGPAVRVSQMVVETWQETIATARVTQAVVEIWQEKDGEARIGQCVVEIWQRNPPPEGGGMFIGPEGGGTWAF